MTEDIFQNKYISIDILYFKIENQKTLVKVIPKNES
jgi:hypothetical protein